ncbi:MAG: hypothetical protein FWC41_06325, partial [Firmicutes bacterium]|nr:hypothetical protein [Bacillota bacterium]
IKEPIGQRQPNEDIGSQKDKTGEEITNDKSKNKDDVKQRIKGYLEKIRRTEEKNRIFKYFARAFRKVIQKDSKSAGLKV